MIGWVLLLYLGIRVEANVWYYALLGLQALITIMSFGVKLYNKGKEAASK